MGLYPLEPLVRIRAEEVDVAARALHAASVALEAARVALDAAVRQREAFFQEASRVEEHEAVALASGVLRAADLAQRDRFLTGAAITARAHDAAVAQAEAKLREAREREDDARRHLADRKAQADAALRDRERFVAKERRIAEAKEEENAEDAIRAGGHRT